ncbi:MAG: hypothetical protein Q8921_06745 [Bacteroidota bacterium]|nr:hypothetical protein [Bacteroidota bacterium]
MILFNAATIIFVAYSLLTRDHQILMYCLVYGIIGYGFIFGRLVPDRNRRAGTRYEITNEHVIVRRPPNFFADAVTSFSFSGLTNVNSAHFPDGTGSIYFFDRSFREVPSRRLTKWRASLVAGQWSVDQGASIVFERIPEPDKVLDLIRQLRTQSGE